MRRFLAAGGPTVEGLEDSAIPSIRRNNSVKYLCGDSRYSEIRYGEVRLYDFQRLQSLISIFPVFSYCDRRKSWGPCME